jgi:hypothetical protein
MTELDGTQSDLDLRLGYRHSAVTEANRSELLDRLKLIAIQKDDGVLLMLALGACVDDVSAQQNAGGSVRFEPNPHIPSWNRKFHRPTIGAA